MSLTPYSGEWNKQLASHLIKRSSFTVNKSFIDASANDGLEATLDLIFTTNEPATLPLNPDNTADPHVAIGESWVNATYEQVPGLNKYRSESLASWIGEQMVSHGISIQDKMTLFWHNHFAIQGLNDPKYLYKNYRLMRDFAIDDFRELTKRMTIDVAMLRYLNGNQNTKTQPNENFSRELLELFTVGKGALIGDGDYSTFTEQDVSEMARVLTGWRDIGYNNQQGIDPYAQYLHVRHDLDDKQLSYHFNSTVITNASENEYANLIDVIFESDNVALFIARKLYRWFVFYDISDAVEQDVIVPMADLIRDNDYVIEPALRALLGSEHFFESCNIGAMIRNPLDYYLHTMSLFEYDMSTNNLATKYQLNYLTSYAAALMQMNLYNAPSVAGWKPYYQAPAYYRIWLNSSTLPIRKAVVDVLWITGLEIGDQQRRIDPFQIVQWTNNPLDINALITDVAEVVLTYELTDGQHEFLKDLVLQGLAESDWIEAYANYQADPTNEDLKNVIEVKLVTLFVNMCYLPEYQLN
jgi:uncharacterized protein (DUF1800 family)